MSELSTFCVVYASCFYFYHQQLHQTSHKAICFSDIRLKNEEKSIEEAGFEGKWGKPRWSKMLGSTSLNGISWFLVPLVEHVRITCSCVDEGSIPVMCEDTDVSKHPHDMIRETCQSSGCRYPSLQTNVTCKYYMVKNDTTTICQERLSVLVSQIIQKSANLHGLWESCPPHVFST